MTRTTAAPRPGPARADVDAVLLLHYHDLQPGSADLVDSCRSFGRYSRFPVFSVNTSFGFPAGLRGLNFQAVLLHYTLFYAEFAPLTDPFLEWLHGSDSYVVAFFQDEQAFLGDRIRFCDEYDVDCVYTLFEEPHATTIYGAPGRSVVPYIPGYVSEALEAASTDFALDHASRPIDVGYRGRRLPAHWGSAALEKFEIGEDFRNRAEGRGLVLDIESDESKRIYGSKWYEFIASCKATLGTEAGASIIDSEGLVPGSAHWLTNGEQGPRSDTVSDELEALEGRIPYRTISPRHLQAAALRSTQILFEGRYSGHLEPWVHYIPLRKDFSNFDDVLAAFLDPSVRETIATTAHRDLIQSGALSYETFVAQLDRNFAAAGIEPSSHVDAKRIERQLYPPKVRRRSQFAWRRLKNRVNRSLAALTAARAGRGVA